MLPHEDEEVARVHRHVDIEVSTKNRDRRERIATAVLAGMVQLQPDYRPAALNALRYADALIAELDKPERVKA